MVADVEIVVVNGVRYRAEDAKRLGLVPEKPAADDGEKQRKAAPNKARTTSGTK